MQADTTTLAPTDAEIEAAYRKVWSTIPHAKRISAFAHEIASTLAARWGAPAPASGEPETCKCCGEGSARIVVRRECDTCTSVYSGVAEHRLQKSLAAPPAQEARVPLSDAEALAIVRSVPALLTAEDEWLWAIREVEKYHGIGITAAQKETP